MTSLKKIRVGKHTKEFCRKITALVLALALWIQLLMPYAASAQSADSGQLESQGSSTGASDMVDLFTGDFNYSIPLMEVEGYPINLNYDAGVSMNQEANWVGLGWNLNVGSITRDLRGLPDDFNGDVVTKQTHLKADQTTGKNLGGNLSVLASLTVFYIADVYAGVGMEFKKGKFTNSYAGLGKNWDFNLNLQLGVSALGNSAGGSANLGFSRNTQTGIGVNYGLGSQLSYGGGFAGVRIWGESYDHSTSTTRNSRTGRTRYKSFNQGEQKLLVGTSKGSSREITFGTRTYTPRFNNSITQTTDFNRKANGAYLIWIWAMGIKETYSYDNHLTYDSENIPAYGYLNLQNAANTHVKLMDFNRENEGLVNDQISVLPVTNLTYDLFTMSTGLDQGQFRAHRNDIGTVSNSKQVQEGTGYNYTKEKGFGLGYKKVVMEGVSNNDGTSKVLDEHNTNYTNEKYASVYASSATSETFYFKEAGELTPLNTTLFSQWGDRYPVKRSVTVCDPSSFANLFTTGLRPGITGGLTAYNYQTGANVSYAAPTANVQTGKSARATLYQSLNALEAKNIGFNLTIPVYNASIGSINTAAASTASRTTSYKKDHHLSEIDVVRPDGSRYVFNVPVYSLREKQVVFNASGNSQTCSRNEISYSAGSDNSSGNTKGRDNVYQSEEVPAYAHSFLLGAILSDDYNDLTGDGVTEDDMGNYIKFNHACVYNESNAFGWRSPYGASQASYIQNNISYNDDDMGMYSYGEKELWYPHSIEGKNYIAYFILSARDDMFSTSENGSMNTSKPGYKLDKIVLYSKEDIRQNGLSNAEPLQTVEFEYDYSLCKNFTGNKNTFIPGNYSISGKLTLKKIRFSGSRSKKGRLNPYIFTYNSGTQNPDFSPMATDRWGIYKSNSCSGSYNFSNAEFPYATKSKTQRDDDSQCWLLNEIKLPEGGKIDVQYESDDYAYVENKKSMEMFRVIGLNRHTNINDYPSVSTSLTKTGDKKKPNDIIYVQLDQNLVSTTPGNAGTEFFEKYLQDIYNTNNRMYYKFLVKNKGITTDAEWVQGFAAIREWGVVGSYPYNVGYIKLESVPVDNRSNWYEVNPVLYQAWQNLRTNVSRAIYPDDGSGTLSTDLGSLIHGINRSLNNKTFCRNIVPVYSMVRLTNPDHKKMGGGNRVKKITYTDNWAAMSGESDFTYGTEYFYDANGDGTGISTGVATYEPYMGNEENPFRQPIEYTVYNDKLPDDKMVHIGPFGESLLNGPSIGYSKVTTRSISHAGVTHNTTGKTVHEFYTARDYPTLINRTTLNRIQWDNKDELTPLFASMGVPETDLMVCSQGFSVEKNDMHGNPKKITHYNSAGNEVHSSEYKYQDFWDDLKVIDANGNVSTAKLGKDLDIVLDANVSEVMKYDIGETKTRTYSIIPDFNTAYYEAKRLQVLTTHVITKTIQHYSIMKKVIERYNGSETTSEMLAYDKNTGQLLVSSNTNEYEKPVYTVSMPSYWYYKGMGLASDTYNNHFSGVNISSTGTLSFTSITGSVDDYFLPGDELLIQSGSTMIKAWVLSTNTSLNTMKVIDANGSAISAYSGVTIRVVRSGKRNLNSLPMQEVVLSEHNPVSGSRIDIDDNVLDASATEFFDYWSTICNKGIDCSGSTPSTSCTNEPNDVINPYTKGILGNWRMKRTHSYQIDLAENSTSVPVYTRTGGRFSAFVQFFDYNTTLNAWYPIFDGNHPHFSATNEKWRKTGEAMWYDMNGNLVEATDALGLYSSTQYGYNQSTRFLPVASADHSRLCQMGFDGFEDYTFASSFASSCLNKIHFGFGLSGSDLGTDAHTGRYSLKIVPSANFVMERKIETPCSPPEKFSLDPSTGLFKLDACACLPVFSPIAGKYTVTAWAKQLLDNPAENYPDAYIEIRINTTSGWLSPITFSGSNTQPVVENWNRIEGTFDIPANATCIQVKLGNTGTANKNLYFDDLRIHPFNSGMAANVYDPLTLRLWSQLDGYNFASYMEYNENGSMVRVKRETERGIRTTQEIRSGLGK